MINLVFLQNFVLTVILLIQVSHGSYLEMVSAGPYWGYTGNTGPAYWCQMTGYEKCCNTRLSRQSPIDIVTRNATHKRNTLKLVNFHTLPKAMTVVNLGTTVELLFSTPVILTMSGGPLKFGDKYYLDYIHAHWGQHKGSEHKIDGKQTQMEPSFHDNPAFATLISSLKNVRRAGQNVTVKSPLVSSFMPRRLDSFYSYIGSLTTPPCSETVTWLVSPDHISMSHRQMNEFKTLYTRKEFEHNKNNVRPIQPTNGRTVELWSSH